MKKSFLLGATLMVAQLLQLHPLQAQIPSFLWARSAQGTTDVFGSSITTDGSGNSYTTGSFQGSVTFGSSTFTAQDHTMYLVKHDPAGNVLWARTATGTGTVQSLGVAADAMGNSYVTGFFSASTVTFGTQTFNNSGQDDLFLVKYSPAGDVLWARHVGSPGIESGRSLAVDASGNCYLTGWSSGQVTMGTFPLQSFGGIDVLVAKYDPAGNVLWARTAGGSELDSGYDIALDAAGNCYVTGLFMSPQIQPNGTTLYSNRGMSDIFLFKYTAAGSFDWGATAGGTGMDGGQGVAADANGNCYLTGYYRDAATFSTTTVTGTQGANNIFVARYDAGMAMQWVHTPTGTGSGMGSGLVLDGSGNAILAGRLSGDAGFGSYSLSSNGIANDVLLVNYTPAGQALWAMRAGGVQSDDTNDIATDPSGSLYLTGTFQNSTQLGTHSLSTSSASREMFVTRLSMPSGLQEPAEAAVQLHPNPSSGRFRLSLPAAATGEVAVAMLDVTGRSVFSRTIAAEAGVLEVVLPVELPKGLYLVQAQAESGVYSGRIVVE